MDLDDLKNRFTYHRPDGDQAKRYHQIRASGLLLAEVMLTLCPKSRELSLAITKIEESVMWANAAIARNEGLVDVGEPEEKDAG